MDEGTTERLPRVESPPRIGQVLGSRYTLYNDVGCGPLAHVYGAWDDQVDHRVAVKILEAPFLAHDEVVQAFQDNARRTAGLPAHRNIVSIHHVEREGRVPYIVMEYVPGHSVRSILNRAAPPSLDEAFDVCRQVAQGLDVAHEYGVVHGNIEPENILVLRNGQAKVTDFGLGRVMDIAEICGALVPLARARYLSPEQALGRTPDPASDLYSLGVVLFEMLTGRLPSQPGDVSSILSDRTRESSRVPAAFLPAIPMDAWRIVLRALARNPEARYPTAGAFASALHEYLLLAAGSTVMDLPASAIREGLNASRPRPTVSVVTPSSQSPRTHAARRENRSVKPRRLTVMSLVFVAALVLALVAGWLAYRAISDVLNGWGQPPGVHAGWTVKRLQESHARVLGHPPASAESVASCARCTLPSTFGVVRPTIPAEDLDAGMLL